MTKNVKKKKQFAGIAWKTSETTIDSYFIDWGGPTKQKCYVAGQSKSMAMSDCKEKHNVDMMVT